MGVVAENTQNQIAENRTCIKVKVRQFTTSPAGRQPNREYSQDVKAACSTADLSGADNIYIEGWNVA